MKTMRTSYSQHNTFIKCPQHWNISYNERYKSPIAGASLYFGTAVDSACEAMLLKNGNDPYQVFNDYWLRSWNFGKATPVFDNDDITYGYKDMDKQLLDTNDLAKIAMWAQQLGLVKSVPTPEKALEIFDDIVKKKKNPYKKVKPVEMKYFNRCSWLSMKKKGEIMLKSFEEQFVPMVTKVVAVQQRADIKDPGTGDSVVGYIDMIVELKGYDKPIIIDLKTAARPYTQDMLDFSEQLTLYAAMKGKYALDPTDAYDTDLVGYVVLCKDINKENTAICKSCGHTRDGRHKKCNNEVVDTKDPSKMVRCNGEWDEKIVLNPQVQVMVAEKSQEQVNSMLQDIAAIIAGMKNSIIYRNTSACSNWYGSQCPFFDACHHGDYSKLVKK